MIKFIKRLFIVLVVGYLAICVALHFYQERLLFFPEVLDADYKFEFANKFTEENIITKRGDTINSLLFKTEDSKGVILYLHGNAGSLKSVGNESENLLPLGYDVFMVDYAGYGKSSGKITSQAQLFQDMQTVYDRVKRDYKKENIIIVGYSIGTGIAAKLASDNNPSMLVLQAPYYSMVDMMERRYAYVPTFILDYTLDTHKYIKDSDVPTYLFHGNDDLVIPLESSQLLAKELNLPLYIIKNQGHNGLTGNVDVIEKMKELVGE